MFKNTQTSDFTRRTLALTAILGASFAGLGAQTAVPAASSSTDATVQTATTSVVAEPAFSSSAADNEMASAAAPFNFVNAMQYGGRQSYGRPRYRGGNTNPDGSNKWMGFGGVGMAAPVADTSNYLTPSWAFQVGVGRQWSNHFALPIQFDYDHFGFQGTTLANQQNLYNYYINLYNQQNPGNAVSPIAGLDGTSHVWSFTLDPTYTFTSGQGLGAYVVGGVGFYHKTANFTIPAVGEYCDPYYGCYQYQANQTIDKYTSNAPGFNGGFGVTYKFSRFSNERFYAEARYVYVVNSPKAGVTSATASPTNANVANDYPANSNRTSYFPVKVGVRF